MRNNSSYTRIPQILDEQELRRPFDLLPAELWMMVFERCDQNTQAALAASSSQLNDIHRCLLATSGPYRDRFIAPDIRSVLSLQSRQAEYNRDQRDIQACLHTPLQRYSINFLLASMLTSLFIAFIFRRDFSVGSSIASVFLLSVITSTFYVIARDIHSVHRDNRNIVRTQNRISNFHTLVANSESIFRYQNNDIEEGYESDPEIEISEIDDPDITNGESALLLTPSGNGERE